MLSPRSRICFLNRSDDGCIEINITVAGGIECARAQTVKDIVGARGIRVPGAKADDGIVRTSAVVETCANSDEYVLAVVGVVRVIIYLTDCD